MIAQIIINSSVKTLNRTFDYIIPDDLDVKIGDRVFVPFGKKKSLDEGIVVNISETSEFKDLKEIASIQKDSLDANSIELSKWMAKRYFCNISDCLKLMLRPGTTGKNVANRIKDREINVINLAKSEEEIIEALEELKSEKQIKILKFILNNPDKTRQEIAEFTNTSVAIINTLVKNGYLKVDINTVRRTPLINTNVEKTTDLKLTDEQQKALDAVDVDFGGEFLLYGITGSGKTEIYLQLIRQVLDRNKSSIVLVPEISLTPQTINRFVARFGADKIAVLHSKLSSGERYDEWNKIKHGDAKIIIGARSAIFAPAKDLGLVIIDEEHDESYMSEMTPRYDARDVARFICSRNNIPLILGSATPDLKSYYRTEKEEATLLTLNKRANNSNLPEVKIVDLKEELKNGNNKMLSYALKKEIEHNLVDKKQTILFLNRRGFSTFLMCKDCGYTFKCNRCNITLTYHKFENRLKCHYCGHEEKVATTCPECESDNIRFFGGGTQKLEEEVLELFPEASTIRMDVDTVSKKNSHEEILDKFRNENIDILIGTQMVVKGHHFPNVTLVGVINADTSLNIGDFRAAERTFQTITQVAGRAGRDKDKGRVIIQTYNPDNYAIEFSKKQDYKSFYDTELPIRKALKYPPFCDIIVIDMSAKNMMELKIVAKKLHSYLKQRVVNEKFGLLLYSPVPSPIDKIKDRYRYRMIIKCIYDDKVNELLTDMMEEYNSFNNKTSRVVIQVNPYNML